MCSRSRSHPHYTTGKMAAFSTVFSVLLILVVGASIAAAAELAKIRQDGGVLMTSSTLKWVDARGGRIPHHAVPITEDDPSKVWCRARQRSTYVSGALQDGVCKVPFLSTVYSMDSNFQILVSLNGSARLLREKWDKFRPPPPNAISPELHTVLALFITEDGRSHAGLLKPRERRADIVEDGIVVREESALILVEDEPLRYDLRDIELDEPRTEISPDEVELTEVVLMNPSASQRRIKEPATVTVRHLVYWGRVKGTLAGRNALVITPEGEQRHLVWGDQNELDRAHQLLLEADLPPGTGTNVRVLGTIRKTEAPYTGKLTAIYADGGRLSRTIQGLHMDQRLLELRAIYSPPYFLNNKTELNMPAVTQILYKSTTTTTTTSTTSTTPAPVAEVSTDSEPEVPRSGSLSTDSKQPTGSASLAVCDRFLCVTCFILWFVSTTLFRNTR